MSRTLLYPEQTVHRKLPLNYEEMAKGKEQFILPEENIDATYLVELSHAYVSPFGVVFRNGFVVKDSVYSMFDPRKQWLTFYKKRLLNKVRKVSGDCLVVHHAYYQNYYHFLLEILPRLFVMKERAPALTLIINETLPSFAREYLSLFRFNDIVYLKDEEIAKVDKIYFPTHLRGLAYNPAVMREMAAWLRQQLLPDDAVRGPERIFISRANAKYRKTVNEAEVIALLRDKGFEFFDPGNAGIREQAAFFSHARYIIGSHGAGFSNMLFSRRAELVIDLIHEQHPQDCFYNLACIFDIGYYYFQCKGTGADSYPNNDDIIVDLQQFSEVCERYLR